MKLLSNAKHMLAAIVFAFAGYSTMLADNINWLNVEISTPGTLGQEVLYQVNVLSDVEYLCVKGTMNSDDWTTVKNMANLKGADFSQAISSEIPDMQFSDKRDFHIMMMPQGLKIIGNEAFYYTGLTSVSIPASVTSIGNYAFRNNEQLATLDIPSNSALTTIGEYAFQGCAFQSVRLPNGITTLASGTFAGCRSLSSVVLPVTLQTIGYSCFAETSALKNISFPQTLTSIEINAFAYSGLEEVHLPQGLTNLGDWAFGACYSLKSVVLPATPNIIHNAYNNSVGYRHSFGSCSALEKVVSLSATPPAIVDDPFTGVDLSQVTLVVPAFAIVDYKLDTYWHEFGTIIEGAEPTLLNIGSALSLTNNRRPTNKADILLSEGARLTVGGNAPLEIGTLTFTVNLPYKNYGQLLNKTTAVSADQIVTRFWLWSDRWYFITPLHDINVNDVSHSESDAAFIFRYYNAQNRAANGPTGSWQNLTGNTLKAGQGYILQSNRTGWLTLPATPSGKGAALVSGDVTTALKTYNAANSADASWNYVGNPYPCYYDTYYMDVAAPITVWDDDNWTYRAYSPIDDDYVLSPMQAFFIQKPAAQSQILFRQEGRQFYAETQRPASARRIADGNRQLFDLEVTDGVHTDRTRLVLCPQASLGYEPAADAPKFLSQEASVPQLYTIDTEGNMLAINQRPVADGIVRLGLLASQPGTCTMQLHRGTGQLLLTDMLTGQTIDLTKDTYSFSIDEAGCFDQRFILQLNSVPNGITETTHHTFTDSTYFDLQGRRVNSQPTKGIYIKNGKKQVVK